MYFTVENMPHWNMYALLLDSIQFHIGNTTMPEPCPNHARTMPVPHPLPEPCPNHARTVPEPHPLPEPCPNRARTMPEPCPNHSCKMTLQALSTELPTTAVITNSKIGHWVNT